MGDNDVQVYNKVAEVQRLVRQVELGVDAVGVQVAHVGQRAEETNDRLTKLALEFQAFAEKSERARNLQLAETRIVAVEARLEHDFGHYKKVRNVAIGMLQGFDAGLVSEDTVRGVSE